jgi:hypothetical protein
MIDEDRFDTFASQLAAARQALADLLGWAPTPGRPPGDHDPSIEAAAKRQLALGLQGSRHEELHRLFAAYTEAVNALWLLAEQSGLTESLVREYVRAHRRVIRESGADRCDLSAEATLAMRAQCIGWACAPDRRRGLVFYARPGITRALSAYVGREASATTGYGDKTAQRRSKVSNRVQLEELDSELDDDNHE